MMTWLEQLRVRGNHFAIDGTAGDIDRGGEEGCSGEEEAELLDGAAPWIFARDWWRGRGCYRGRGRV